MVKSTHTYAVLNVSEQAYAEIRRLLFDAGYDHAFMEGGEIDMHGIALASDANLTAADNGLRRGKCRVCSQDKLVNADDRCIECYDTKPRPEVAQSPKWTPLKPEDQLEPLFCRTPKTCKVFGCIHQRTGCI